MSFRLQATLPDPMGEQLKRLQAELRLDVSDVVEEALGLFSKAVFEAKRGARLAFMHDEHSSVREYSSPALSRLEWEAQDESHIILANKDFDSFVATLQNPPEPNDKLRTLMRGRRAQGRE